MSERTTTGGGWEPDAPVAAATQGPRELDGSETGSTLAATNGPHLSEEDGQRITDAMVELRRVAKGRIAAAVIPASWTDDQGKRLARCINRVLEAGESGLRTIEDVLHG